MPTRRAVLASAALAPTVGTTRRAAAQEATPTGARGAVETQRDVAYGEVDGEALLLDAYLPPARESPRPAVILLHGGAWSFGSRSDMGVAARELAKAGYVAFSIDYRLLNPALALNRWPAQLDDAQRAVRWVRAHAAEYGVDPERLAAYGFSAGAHLAALLGVRETRDTSDRDLAAFPSRVNYVVSLSGDMDLAVPQTDDANQQAIVDFLGGTAAQQPEAYRDASPLSWVDTAAAPYLIVHGGLDDAILAAQSQQMVAALYAAGGEVGYVALPGIGHSGIGAWDLVGPLTLAFLGIQLRPER